jgi:hypothetical protein
MDAGYTNALNDSSSSVSALFAAGLLQATGDKLQLYVYTGEIDDALRDAILALGALIEIESSELGIVQIGVPFESIAALGDIAGVTRVTEPSYGVANAGANLTEGDAILSFDALRAAQGIDGLQTAIDSGDLPATAFVFDGGTLTSTSGGVISTSFRADGDLEAGLGSGVGAEGTAILEIVHDIAPGAQLRFANFATSLEFMAAVDFLASVSDVVIDDIGFFDRPTDGTSDVSTNTASALLDTANPIRTYVNAVGNHALRHYEGPLVAGPDGLAATGVSGALHTFGPTTTTTDALGLGSRTSNRVSLAAGQLGVIFLTWNDDFGAATSDYDIFVFQNDNGALVSASATNKDISNGGDGLPLEVAVFSNSTDSGLFYDVVIQHFHNVSAVHDLEMFMTSGGITFANGAVFNYNTLAGSVPAQSDAEGGVISTGAINAADPGNDTIESFSSQGPTGSGALKPDVNRHRRRERDGRRRLLRPLLRHVRRGPPRRGTRRAAARVAPRPARGRAGRRPHRRPRSVAQRHHVRRIRPRCERRG